ncbi:amidohydrolase family protein [Bosea sp. UNC402CLCol]|uniref:amidohydrolase family protein n=1 Tax=Bosea sp. UNC402CLCol TaxID=1510531 RepID=UPI00056FDE94|nr:amidohydrolase family protein [Bosea sp. UNC402CLCol]
MAAPTHVPVRPDWLALRDEAALDSGLPIVDAHHHLWDRPQGQRYLFDELLADMASGHDIRATVFVQSRSMYRPDLPEAFKPVGEVEFANGVAAQAASGLYGRHQACAGIVAHADLRLGERLEPVLEALSRAGGSRLRGIRNQTAWHSDPAIASNPVPPEEGVMRDPAFAAGVRQLAHRGLVLDIWAYHTQLDEVAALADACPETKIVLDHCGGPLGAGPYRGRRNEVFAQWSAAMAALARRPNLRVKLGGLAMRVGGFDFHEALLPPSSERLAEAWSPYILRCIELFGPQRCMFESNFPVDKGMVGYGVLWNGFKRIVASFSPHERAWLFHRAAMETYRLDLSLTETG